MIQYPAVSYWKSARFYASLFVASVIAFIFISLAVAIFGGDEPWPVAVVWVVNIAMWILSLLAGYSYALSQFKKRAVQKGFPAIVKPPGGPETG